MQVTKILTNAFWKGEIEVKGRVEDDNAVFLPRLFVKGSQVYDYSCSCFQRNSYKGMCRHCERLWEEYQKQRATRQQKPVMTTPSVHAMIREYTNREVAQIVRAGEEEKVKLTSRLIVSRYEIKAEFKVGRERMYVVKDLLAFVQAVEQGAYVEYGKQLAFHHNKEVFSEESQELLKMLQDAMQVYREHFKMFQKNLFSSVPSVRELSLSAGMIERYIESYWEQNLEITDNTGKSRQVYVTKSNPNLEIAVRPLGTDGICVAVPSGIQTFFGTSHLYVLDGPELYVCDEAYSSRLHTFLHMMLYEYGATGQVDIQKKEIPLFYERVLRRIEPYITLHAPDIDWNQYRPEPLRAKFVFDSEGPNQVSVEPTLFYGETAFSPMEDEHLPRQIVRDVPAEFRISQTLLRYFKHRDRNGKKFLIQNQNEELYLLLKEGMEEFMKLGEVVCLDSFYNLQILPPSKIQVGVRMTEGWLDFHVDTDTVSREELAEILKSYQEKKTFYRTTQGAFLELQDDGVAFLSRLSKDLGVSEKEIETGNIRLPAYRAMYVDQMVKERAGIRFERDKMFRTLVRGMRTMEDSEFEVPMSLSEVLREYQKTGYRWLKTLDSYGFGGILADDMGLGKTVQMIAVILKEAMEHPESRSLIVCPSSLIYNWGHEFHMFAPMIRVKVVVGTTAVRQEMLKQICTEDESETVQVLITSYDLLRRDYESYAPFTFRYQVLDEAQYIKNALTQNAKAVKSIRSRTRFALTGTPIENHLGELWSIMDYLMPGFLFSYHQFRKELELPIVKNGEQDTLERLHRLIAPFVLRRVKKDVLKELPEKMEMVVYSGLEEEQKDLYEANAILLKKLLEEGSGREQMKLLAGLTRLRQICCDPALCYEDYHGNSAKMETCLGLIENGIAAGHRILLFSQFTSMLDRIKTVLEERGISYYLLTGATSREERRRQVLEFGTTDTMLFLISLRAGGTGLNLTAADMVIHYDPWWNEAAQNQATDRVYRIGQNKQVTVFQLIMKQTIEEGILRLQNRKRALSDQVITEGMTVLESLNKEELLAILGGEI